MKDKTFKKIYTIQWVTIDIDKLEDKMIEYQAKYNIWLIEALKKIGIWDWLYYSILSGRQKRLQIVSLCKLKKLYE